MRDNHAFTLLEVLLAAVLLAIVIGVCAPFVSHTSNQDHLGLQSEFLNEAAQLIATAQSRNNQLLDYEDYAAIAQSQGWGCERVETIEILYNETQSLGEWVRLSDGLHMRLCWAAIPEAGSESP